MEEKRMCFLPIIELIAKKIRQIALNAGLDVDEIRMICSSAQMVLVPPLVIAELLWIRFSMLN
jgi:hypothetical protein